MDNLYWTNQYKQKSTKGAGVAISEASVDLDFVHIYDHQVSESDWINAAGVFATRCKENQHFQFEYLQ